jgi:hypothetical protein
MTLWIILQHTPVWVWILMAFLLYRGLAALRPSVISVRRALILPIVFLIWGLSGLIFDPGEVAARLVGFALALVIGFLLGRLIASRSAPPTLIADKGLLAMPGSPLPLIIIALTFFSKYALAVAIGFDKSLQSSIGFETMLGAVGGLSAGALWGLRLTQFARASGGAPLSLLAMATRS